MAEVTVAEYLACAEAGGCSELSTDIMTGCWWPGGDPGAAPDLAVDCVTWQQAHDFCAWEDKRLCTEAEWEKAARGPHGRFYPWGDEPPSCDHAVLGSAGGDHCPLYVENAGSASPPGMRPLDTSPYGALDMAGNVSEWVCDWPHTYVPAYQAAWGEEAPTPVLVDPVGADGPWEQRQIRGGWATAPAEGGWFRSAYRQSWWVHLPAGTGGIRCCRSTPDEGPCPGSAACGELECGPDPVCGVECGPCPEGWGCEEGGCVCLEDEACPFGQVCAAGECQCSAELACTHTACGPSPICDVDCGACDDGLACYDGQCLCGPGDCASGACGPVPGCPGGACGCPLGTWCHDGECVGGTCWPDCPDKVTVPAGDFVRGCEDVDPWDDCGFLEWPAFEVYLDAFAIDATEVTVEEYAGCVAAGACGLPAEIPNSSQCTFGLGAPALPVTCVSWYDARDFCEWTGARLCTEAEWEKAARGPDGRPYPWGDEEASCALAVTQSEDNQAACGQGEPLPHTLHPLPVGSKPDGASPYGALDLAGNAAEWTWDWFGAYHYGILADHWYYRDNPWHPFDGDVGAGRVVRGGDYLNGPAAASLLTWRRMYFDPATQPASAGIRCCVSLPEEGSCPEAAACDQVECGLDPVCKTDCGGCPAGEKCWRGQCVCEEMTCAQTQCGAEPVCGVECHGPCPDQYDCLDGLCFLECDWTDCTDDHDCTVDTCQDFFGCKHELSDAECDDGNACTVEWCDEDEGCKYFTQWSGACDDGDPCTINDECIDGVCVASQPSCDDGFDCTADSCWPSGCLNKPDDALCDDGNPCTEDSCSEWSGCQNTPKDWLCDDGHPCTEDFCNAATGCVFLPHDSWCADEADCSVDLCDLDDGCLHLVPEGECDDGVACTVDACDPELGCTHEVDHAACDDGVACTWDQCDEVLGCVHDPSDIACADDHYCTADTCDPVLGCLHAPDDAACVDSNECTVGTCDVAAGCLQESVDALCDDADLCTEDTCESWGCHHDLGPAIACDDNVECTIDACDPVAGCVSTPNDDACESASQCAESICHPVFGCTEVPDKADCDDQIACTSDVCVTATGACLHNPDDADCDDGVACTDDLCDPALGCVHVPQDGACPDESLCSHVVCDEVFGCLEIPDKELCDDGIGCTSDVCISATGACMHNPMHANCDDGLACTIDTCLSGEGGGCAHAPDCDDGVACTVDVCDAATGACVHTADAGLCDDGVACTTEACDPASGCEVTALDALCDDENDCTLESCDLAEGCVYAKDAALCDDGVACTKDLCDLEWGCEHVPVDEWCLDGSACTDDLCDPDSGCVWPLEKSTCDDQIDCTTDTCDPLTGGCAHAPDDAACDDGAACTDDTCDEQAGCLSVPLDDACDDQVDCTGDACIAGLGCLNLTMHALCDDGDECTADTCALGAGCQHAPVPGCGCDPDCAGKECGDDGCGGSCGSCDGAPPANASALMCQPFGVETRCVAVCDKEWGDADHDLANGCECQVIDQLDDVGDGVDQNCDGADGIDPDWDGVASIPSGGDDCDDTDPAVHPGATDLVGGACQLWSAEWGLVPLPLDGATGGAALVVDGGGALHVAYGVAGGDELWYATDRTGEWALEPIDQEAPVGAWASARHLALDGGGHAHVVYRQGATGDVELRYATNASGSWSASTVEQGANIGGYASLALGGDGAAHIAHYDWTAQALRYVTSASGAWEGEVRDDWGDSGKWCSIAVADDGVLHISYHQDPKFAGDVALRTLRWATTYWGSWGTDNVWNGDWVGEWSSVAVDAAGTPHMTASQSGGGVRYFYRTTWGSWPKEVVDPAEGTISSLALDSAGWPWVAYYANTSAEVRIATRTEPGVWEVETLSVGGSSPSLALGPDDRRYVLFFDADGQPTLATHLGCQGWATAADADCDGADGVDADGDDHASVASGGDDCDDDDPTTHGGVASDDGADGVDNDCDGGPGVDGDGDGHGSLASGGDDCDDESAAVFPGALDLVGDGADQSCDGLDGIDVDGDDHASVASGGDDCDDDAAGTFPGAPDAFGDDVDQDCDGADGVDLDEDGYASLASGGDDCADDDPEVFVDAIDWADGFCGQSGREWVFADVGPGKYHALAATGLAFDQAQRPHIVFYDAATNELYYAMGATSAAEGYAVEAMGVTGYDSTLGIHEPAGGPLVVHVAYSAGGCLRLASRAEGATEWTLLTADCGPSGAGANASLRVDAAGVRHVAYQHKITNYASVLAYGNDASGAWQVVHEDPTTGTGLYASLGLDPIAGAVHIGHYKSGTNDLMYTTDESGSWATSMMESYKSVGAHTALAVGPADGSVHIAYRPGSGGGVKLRSRVGGSWSTQTVDSAISSVTETAITVAPDGARHLSYQDNTAKDLRWASDESGAWQAAALDTEGTTGNLSSIALDATGQLHIVYHDSATEQVVHARGQVACLLYGDPRDLDCDGADGVDGDGDTYASEASGGDDCDDISAAAHPGADELCGNSTDEDCDGDTDEADCVP